MLCDFIKIILHTEIFGHQSVNKIVSIIVYSIIQDGISVYTNLGRFRPYPNLGRYK